MWMECVCHMQGWWNYVLGILVHANVISYGHEWVENNDGATGFNKVWAYGV